MSNDKPKASAVPEGWKLVPVEPTPEMLSAAWNGGALGGEDDHRECYGYMVAAAPSAPQGENNDTSGLPG